MKGASGPNAWQWEHKDLVLQLHVQPGAKHEGYGGLHDNRIKLAVAAPPADGRANRRVIEILAEAFGVPRAGVELTRGESSRRKTVRVRKPGKLPEWIAD